MPGHNAPHHEGDILTRPACIRRCSPLSWRGCWCNPAFVRWIASWRPQAQHMETSIIAHAFNNLKDTVPLRISGSQMIPFSRTSMDLKALKLFPVHHILSHLITSHHILSHPHLPSSPVIAMASAESRCFWRLPSSDPAPASPGPGVAASPPPTPWTTPWRGVAIGDGWEAWH